MTTFGKSWLVQRLERPLEGGRRFKDNPFSFGGGLVNGGLSPEAMNLLRDVFSFDYMGAAEFEFGAVPKALQGIAKAKLAAFQFKVENRAVYGLAPELWQSEAEARIREFAKDYGKDYYQLKGPTRLHAVLTDAPYTDRLCGWLELDNGFFFFTDETMWRKTCDLFGVEVESAQAAT